jgi:hypothetical protein
MFDPMGGTPAKFQEFRVDCEAGKWGKVQVEAAWFSIAIAQRIKRNGNHEMLESVGVYCSQELEGALVIRVIVFNPDWDAPMQIARIVSRPDDPRELLTPIGFNLDHISLNG